MARVKQVITPTVVGVLSGFLYFVFSYLDEFIAFVLLEAVGLLWLKIWWAIRTDNKVPLKGRRMSGQTEICAAGAWAPSVGAPPNIIHGLLWFDKLPSRDRLAEDLRTRLLQHRGFKRFLCGVYQPAPDSYCWDEPIPLDQFDLDKHITVVQVDGEDAAHRKVEDLLVLPIPASLGGKQDLSFPQWEVYMIQNTGSGRSVIAARFNHAMGDGLSLLNAFLALLTDEKGEKVVIPAFNPTARGDQEYEAVFKAQPKAAMGTEATAEPAHTKPAHPHHHKHHKKTPFELFLKYATLAIKAIPASIQSVMIGLGKDNDAPTSLKEKDYPQLRWNPKRRMVIMPSMKLEDIKAIKTKHKCTINDVVISLLAGATSRFLKAHNDATLNGPTPPKVRVSLPFAFPRNLSLSPDTTEEGMRNLWSLVSVALNVDPKITAVQRLAQSKLACDAMKNSPTPYLNMMMIQILADLIPMSLKLVTATNVFASHTFCLSNVPGPAVPVYLAGERADNICGALATLSSHVVVTSYNSTVTVSYVMNEDLVPDYKQFAQFVTEEFEELVASTKAE